MAFDVVDTVRLARTNRQRHKRLLECQEELDQRAAEENAALLKERQTLYDEALVPFRDVHQRLQHVDPVKPALIERPTAGSEAGIALRRRRKIAVTAAAVGTLAGGALLVVAAPPVAGRAAAAGTYRAVRAFGTASTGRAIRGLRGAAAHSATIARIGDWSAAAGDGRMAAGQGLLSKIHTTTADLTREVIVQCQLQALSHGRQQRARELERSEREAQDAASALSRRNEDVQRVLQDLRSELVRRLPSFTTLVEACDDFSRYDSRQRAEVAAMVELDDLAVMVMNCPITDADGRISEGSGQVVADAATRIQALVDKP